MHRNLGRHISQVKAINTGTYLWFPHELAVMRATGNEKAAAALGAPAKISAGATAAEKHARALAIYEPAAARLANSAMAPANAAPPQPELTGRTGPTRVAAPTPKLFSSPAPAPKLFSHLAPAAAPVSREPDLISLLDAEPPKRAPPPADPFGEFVAAQPAQPVQPLSGRASAAVDVPFAHKKAHVLSLFQQPCAATARATPRHPAHGAGFFAQYGL